MKPEELQQKIAEYYTKLPKEAQETFSSMQWLETLRIISIKYELSEQQIGVLSTETTLLLLGIISLAEYKDIIENELNTSKESLNKILIEINDSILKDILPKLEEAFDNNNREPIEKESGYETTLYEISKKYNLTVSQMNVFGESVMNVVSGSSNSDKFIESLKNLQLPADKIKDIVNDTNEKIFRKIREKLMENTKEEGPEEQSLKTPSEIAHADEKPIESREELLKSIENPQPINIVTNKKLQIDQKELPAGNSGELKEQIPEANPTNIPKDTILGDIALGDKKETPSILMQKLSGSFQIPAVQTDHSLSNLSQDSMPNSIPKVDPYRETLD